MTLADIAAAAGVSTATVSRVMNRKPGVRESTRATVLRALKAAGYDADSPGTARNVVAILVPELSNPSFAQYSLELTQVLFVAEYTAIICPAGQGGASEPNYLDMLLDSDISGIVSVSGASADSLASKTLYERLEGSDVPAVFINGNPDAVDAPFFCTSDAGGIELAVDHLRELGHERIGLAVGQQRYMPTQRKIEAFVELGFSEEDSIVATDYTADGGARAGRRLISAGHTAVICGSDVMALGLIRDRERNGMRVPDDFNVIGYDDSPIMRLTNLTTIRQPVNTISEAAVGALLRLMAGEDVPSGQQLFDPDLTIRQSTGPL